MTASPLDDFRDLLNKLPEPAGPTETATNFAGMARWLQKWTGKTRPQFRKPLVAIFAGTHGVAAHGVSSLPISATAQAVDDCATGKAPVSRLCLGLDLGLKVFDLALELPTADFTVAPALDEKNCAATMAFGMEALADGTDLVCLGSFGVGGATSSAAIIMALNGGQADEWAMAANGAVTARRESAIASALAFHGDHLGEPFEAMARLGGREFAAIAGAIVAARFQSVPVVLDGLPAFAAAVVLAKARAGAVDHCRLAAPLPTSRLNALAGSIGLVSVSGQWSGEVGQGPLDGAMALSTLKAAAVLATG